MIFGSVLCLLSLHAIAHDAAECSSSSCTDQSVMLQSSAAIRQGYVVDDSSDMPLTASPGENPSDDKEWIMKGCPKLDNKSGYGFWVQKIENKAGIRCCSMDGLHCTTPKKCRVQKKDNGYKPRTDTYEQATAVCEQTGKRLCSRAEVESNMCCNTGGFCDKRLIWTSRQSEAGASKHFHCSARAQCVNQLQFPTAEEFVSFQCECIDEHYDEYLQTSEWPPATTQMCKDFVQCLQVRHSMALRLIVNMARALGHQEVSGNASGLIEGTAAQSAAIGKVLVDRRQHGIPAVPLKPTNAPAPASAPASGGCVAPSNLTYAALVECNCLKDLIHVCGEVLVEDTVQCLFDYACQQRDVCADWKALNCPYTALQLHSHSQERTQLLQLFHTIDEESNRSLLSNRNHKFRATVNTSGSARLRDPLLDRTTPHSQSDLQLQDDYDLSAESLDHSTLAKCNSD